VRLVRVQHVEDWSEADFPQWWCEAVAECVPHAGEGVADEWHRDLGVFHGAVGGEEAVAGGPGGEHGEGVEGATGLVLLVRQGVAGRGVGDGIGVNGGADVEEVMAEVFLVFGVDGREGCGAVGGGATLEECAGGTKGGAAFACGVGRRGGGRRGRGLVGALAGGAGNAGLAVGTWPVALRHGRRVVDAEDGGAAGCATGAVRVGVVATLLALAAGLAGLLLAVAAAADLLGGHGEVRCWNGGLRIGIARAHSVAN